MKKSILLLIVLIAVMSAQAQEFGLSFSYFIPKNGYFSTPISPFSIRGLGVNFNRFASIETGASLYRMSGISVKDMGFVTKESIVGPNFTLFIPVEFIISFKGKRTEFDLKGGGFGFLPFANKIDYGNFDRGIRTMENWQVVNSTIDFTTHPGYGWMAGVELTFQVTSQVGISLETNYLAGSANFPMHGSYTGVDKNDQVMTKTFAYNQAKMDMTGLEFSIGVSMSAGGKARPKRRR